MLTRLSTDRGSALMLMPAGVLVVLALAAISVDTAVVHLARRDLLAGADAAASDAVTYGLDEDRLRRGEGYHLDARRVRDAVHGSLGARGLLGRLAAPPRITIDVDAGVTVELRADVDYVFARALPGPHHATVTVRSGAVVGRR